MSAHERRFGVEIECGFRSRDRLKQLLGGFGSDPYSYRNAEGWTIGSDGSGTELKTPILQGKEGFEKVRWAMDLIRENGGYVTRADGLHIHHDAPEFVYSPQKCLQLVKTWRNNQSAIYALVSPYRRTSSACPAWASQQMRQLEDAATYNRSPGNLYLSRNDLNLAALSEHGTIEFRLHEGTLDPDVAIAWIKFGQKLLASVLERVNEIPDVGSDTTFLTRIKLSGQAKAILAQKKALGHHTPASAYR